MASTYSNLKIQLMATGENSGTWGNVTNDNLGVAIEQAITGSVDVTVSSDTTLTLTDTNAAQNARALRLNLGGSGGFNLTVPAIQKLYLINNASLGAVVVKNASGSTVTVPTAKTMWVFSTGTGVVDAVTHLSSLTLGSALPIASGGTGSTTAAFSGANITSLNASAITTGTIDDARTTATPNNTPSAIVERDSNGSFTANVGTFTTITGAGSGITSINASNISSGTVGTARLASGSATSSTYLRGDQTWASISAGLPGYQGQVFTSSGTFTIPTGVTAIKATVLGGGGGGGGCNVSNEDGSGGGMGGGGGGAIEFYTGLTPGATLAVTVGAGGNQATSGGTSSLASGNQSIATVSATGGGGGANGNPGLSGSNGNGGSGSGGDINATGQAGGDNNSSSSGTSAFAFGVPTFPRNGSNANGSPGLGRGSSGQGGSANPANPGRSGGVGIAGFVMIEW